MQVPASFLTHPGVLLRDVDLPRGLGALFPMDAAGYRASIWLDQRAAVKARKPMTIRLDALLERHEATPVPRRPFGAIFHVGHCGSTLVSRLLDDIVPGTLGLREPQTWVELARARGRARLPISAFSERHLDRLSALFLQLASRTFQTTDRALVKATSVSSSLIPEVLAWAPENRAVFLVLSLEVYLLHMLRGSGRRDVDAWAEMRITELHAWLEDDALRWHELTGPQRVAAAWVALAAPMMAALQSPELESRVAVVDFDVLLVERTAMIGRVCRCLDLPLPDEVAHGLASHPIFETHAKLPNKPFTAEVRAGLLRESAREHAAELAEGLTFAEELCAKSPRLAPLAAWFNGPIAPE